jgi:hypothetical protein
VGWLQGQLQCAAEQEISEIAAAEVAAMAAEVAASQMAAKEAKAAMAVEVAAAKRAAQEARLVAEGEEGEEEEAEMEEEEEVASEEDVESDVVELALQPSTIPKIDAKAARDALAAVEAALSEGLVLLGLEVVQYRKLQTLRDAISVLAPSGDMGRYAQAVSALQEVLPQLGPIGARVDAQLAQTPESDTQAQALLQGMRLAAVGVYQRLSDFLLLETKQWASAKASLKTVSASLWQDEAALGHFAPHSHMCFPAPYPCSSKRLSTE